MTGKNIFALLTGLACAIFGSAPRASAMIVDFSLSGTTINDFTASGEITTSSVLDGNNRFAILSITGTAEGEAITGLFNVGGLIPNDLDPTAPFVSQRFQVGFTTADFEFTIGLGGGGLETGTEPLNSDGIFESSDGASVALAEVPEPAALALVAPALIGLYGWRRRSVGMRGT